MTIREANSSSSSSNSDRGRAGASPGASLWQPMETAPKDGTHIIVNGGSQVVPATTVHWFDGAWQLSVNQRGEYSEYIWESPTHWMPLPEPPTEPTPRMPTHAGPLPLMTYVQPTQFDGLCSRLLKMADEQNNRQQAVYTARDIRDAIAREDVLRSAVVAIRQLYGTIEPRRQLVAIPTSADYHANRYDTDDEHVLHVWLETGETYDVRVPKAKQLAGASPGASPAPQRLESEAKKEDMARGDGERLGAGTGSTAKTTDGDE